ncbi:autophagy-related protein 16-2 isoform X4 [Lontra canadensis]|uniref:autophagy-related protein 16-2 isoform X4 n=1 Tax=Lontra canadensis TaxID=76717 RepID=UPI0013F362B6|nr:autophagy-related protein 16-2 isoform X4 [Lontra canadensis]XP_032709063.1 autophagy-related protein 16-2 isoform X4 [Lontra canadensis]
MMSLPLPCRAPDGLPGGGEERCPGRPGVDPGGAAKQAGGSGGARGGAAGGAVAARAASGRTAGTERSAAGSLRGAVRARQAPGGGPAQAGGGGAGPARAARAAQGARRRGAQPAPGAPREVSALGPAPRRRAPVGGEHRPRGTSACRVASGRGWALWMLLSSRAKQARVSLELKKAAKRTVSISESPNTVSQGMREEAESLAPTAEPLSLKSEAGDKWKRPFRSASATSLTLSRCVDVVKELLDFKKRRGHSVGGAPEQRYQSIPVCVAARPPTQVQDVLDAHLSEVNAVCFGPSSSLLATGGADRLIQLWNVVGGRLEADQTLEGAGGSITSVDFDPSVRGLSLNDMGCLLCGLPNPLSMIWEALRQPLPQLSGLRDVASVQVQVKGLRLPLPSFQGSQVLAATYNQAAQLWKVGEVQSKETLSGHTDKVTAAKFKLTRHQAVTGSRDRTVKEWDLGRAYCSRTINVLSYCNDVVCGDHVIISGHYDQKIRFWDSRVPCCTQVIPVQGRVTSLNLSYDQLHLLSCSRDDTLKVIDLRVSNIRQVFRADGFRCGSDWTKAVFSPDRSYALAGSWDGALYIWDVDTGKLEGSLRGPHCTAINAVAWCASGSHVVSVDQARKVVLWR